jgi:hypothetical protein
MTSVVRSQRQANAVYFDLSNAFDLVPHNLLLHKLSSFGFSINHCKFLIFADDLKIFRIINSSHDCLLKK